MTCSVKGSNHFHLNCRSKSNCSYYVSRDFRFYVSIFVNSFVNLRFNQLNNRLKSMSTMSERSPQHKRVLEYIQFKSFNAKHIYQSKTDDDENVLKAARENYHDLITTSRMINNTFGLQILLSVTVYFVLITALLYKTCNIILQNVATQDVMNEELKKSMNWFIFYMARIFTICSSCANISTAVLIV